MGADCSAMSDGIRNMLPQDFLYLLCKSFCSAFRQFSQSVVKGEFSISATVVKGAVGLA